jgi:hypothetical protein
LAAIYIKVNLSHYLSGKNISRKYLKNNNNKMTAVDLWRTKVHLSTIRSQLKMSKRTLRRVLAFAKANPLNPIKSRKTLCWGGWGNKILVLFWVLCISTKIQTFKTVS